MPRSLNVHQDVRNRSLKGMCDLIALGARSRSLWRNHVLIVAQLELGSNIPPAEPLCS